ncbi:hypothetical protein [Vibrio vulnificus]|uniref:hypothetical protein n=1 Tax=Vibrio vulnificus TaxID=672 RepID=UPI00287A07E0|nr:hypothetical protein [Vibrio vulnificus]MDS1873411.1 hypothetical protein [Vibrio vulnificus]
MEQMIPNTKISQTILEFGKPVINALPRGYTKAEFENALLIVITVWNAVVSDSWAGNRRFELELYEALKDAPKEDLLQIKRLVKRKKAKFGSDLRGVGEHWVREDEADFIFGCDARLDVKNAPASSSKH